MFKKFHDGRWSSLFIFIDDENGTGKKMLRDQGMKTRQTFIKDEYRPLCARTVKVKKKQEAKFLQIMETLYKHMLIFGLPYEETGKKIFSELELA